MALVSGSDFNATTSFRRIVLRVVHMSLLIFVIVPMLEAGDVEAQNSRIFPGCKVPKTSKSGFQLKLKVLTYNRLDSLNRLFQSLLKAEYLDDCVDLDIYIDYSSKYEENNPIVLLSESFYWPHGEKRIHERFVNVGVIGQWLEAWYPASDSEYALFLEDDMEVSPVFYRWLKAAVRRFDIIPQDHRNRSSMAFGPKKASQSFSIQHYERLFGLSLQRLLIISAKQGPVGKLPIHNGNMPFAYQLTGTWGQLYFPRAWKKFREWFRIHRRMNGFQPVVDGLINTDWYIRSGDDAWEQWVIRWANDFGKFCIYPNLPGDACLATNHRELGNNYHTKMGVDCQLISKRTRELFNFPKNLQFFNFSLMEINPDRL